MKSTVEPATFATESISATWDEAFPMMLAHHREVGIMPQERFRPDKSFYLRLEESGVLEVFAMRVGGKLCGYNTFTVLSIHPHYPSALWARQDCLYVTPRYRGMMAAEFITWCDRQLRAKHKGVEIVRHVTPRKDYSALLTMMNYREMETAYVLDRETS